MKHADFQLLVSAFADGEVTAEEQRSVEEHLRICEDCKLFLSEIRLMHASIVQTADLEVSPGFAMHVTHKVHHRHEQQIEWSVVEAAARWTMVALSAAAAVWIVVATTGSFSDSSKYTEPTLSSATDSAASVILLNSDDISKNDAYFAMMTK